MDTQTTQLRVNAFFRRFGQTAALVDGKVAAEGVTLDMADVRPAMAAFRRMVRDVEFDICELAPTTFIIARAHGAPYRALPVFLTRLFHHEGFLVRADAGIDTPKDLEGHRVGIRAYSVTKAAWTRGILTSEFGVDLSRIDWVVDDEEHVTQLRLPANVSHAPDGKSLASMMAAGEIQAALAGNAGIGREGPPRPGWEAREHQPTSAYREIWPDGRTLAADWYRRTGIYPFHGLIVVKDAVLDRHPWLAQSLYDAFVESKAIWLDRLNAEGPQNDEDRLYVDYKRIVGPDPLPYGVANNLPSINALIGFAHDQGLTPRRMALDELFVEVTG